MGYFGVWDMNFKLFFYMSIIFYLLQNFALIADQPPLIIVTASYNNSRWCRDYFDSIAQQAFDNWLLLYIDDNSTDDTLAQMQSLVAEYHMEDKVIFIENSQRYGHLYNQYYAIHSCNPNSIVLIVDGDDWLADSTVFKTIYSLYQTQDIWLTYGQFWYWKKNKKGLCRQIPPAVIQSNTIRTLSWRTSHLRTFYAGLFQQIAYEDLLYNGAFFPKCADVATMLPMIEMAGIHIKFIPEVLYIYNDDNPLSYHHNPAHQRELEAYIKTMPAYKPLSGRLW